MSRILYIATSDIHLNTFHVPYLEWLVEQGHVVDIAAEQRRGLNFECVNRSHWLPFPRSIASNHHLQALRELRKIIDDGCYDLIHCHTPVASGITRIAARKWRKRGGKVLYTAHGFHFYKGGPIRNWLTYYPAEFLMSGLTDGIITINKEDFGYVDGRMLHKSSFLIPGIGVESSRFQPVDEVERNERRASLGYEPDEFLLLYTAEFIQRKNHIFLLEALASLAKRVPKVRMVFAGEGRDLDRIKVEAKRFGVAARTDFLGFRSDVEVLASIADVGISSSRHEGLGLGLLEQMMCGVPVVASEDKGHREFVENGVTGYLFPQGDFRSFIDSIVVLYENPSLKRQLGHSARVKAAKFKLEHSLSAMKKIYALYL